MQHPLVGFIVTHSFVVYHRHILKMDDDILVDLFQFMDQLDKEKVDDAYDDDKEDEEILVGYKQRALSPQRNPASKWFVSREEFSGDFFPDFLSGWAYALTPRAARSLVFEASSSGSIPSFFWIDDLWVTGFLAVKVGAKLRAINHIYTVYAEHMRCCLQTRDEHFMCDFAVGPSLGDVALIEQFGKLSSLCHVSSCQRRKWEKSIVNTCVNVDNPFFLPETGGVGEVFVIGNSRKNRSVIAPQ